MDRFAGLKTASVEKKYLNTNSTTHEFLFGALAEIVDNSRDAGATKLKIYTKKYDETTSGVSLNFLDNGCGMDPDEASSVITFGCSKKNYEDEYIGQYGNGLKSGSMRIGEDLIVFTKKNSIGTIIFISRTFLNKESLNSIITPMPSFDLSRNMEPHYPNKTTINGVDMHVQTHKTELEMITKYSPYRSKRELAEQFDLIEGESGTLVAVYNLIVSNQGTPELDFITDPTDILMANVKCTYEPQHQMPHRSFREYASILYLNPTMKIYIQGAKVITKRLDRSLYKPVNYEYTSNKFKLAAEKAKEEAEVQYKMAMDEERKAESRYVTERERYHKKLSSETELTKYVRLWEAAKADREAKKRALETKKRNIREHKTLTFTFGVNLENRDADGLFIYNCHRLILMFTETKEQRMDKELKGIVGIVDIPYTIFKPMHNKQAFHDKVGIQSLIKTVGEYLECYSRYLNFPLNNDFWRDYGYLPGHRGPPALQDKSYKRKRMVHVRPMLQCDLCLKWRSVPFQSRYLDEPHFPPDNWNCDMNPDSNFSECSTQEYLEPLKFEQFKPRQSNMKDLEAQIQRDHEANRERERADRELRLSQQSQASRYANLVQKENQKTSKTIPVFDTLSSSASANGSKKRKDPAAEAAANSGSSSSKNNNNNRLDDYAYSDSEEAAGGDDDTELDEVASDDTRSDRNYVPGRSSQTQSRSNKDKNRAPKRVCKDKTSRASIVGDDDDVGGERPRTSRIVSIEEDDDGSMTETSQQDLRRNSSTSSMPPQRNNSHHQRDDDAVPMMEDISNIQLKIENSMSNMDIYRSVAAEAAVAMTAANNSEELNELKKKVQELEEKWEKAERDKQTHGQHLRTVLSYLVVNETSISGDADKVANMSEALLLKFKLAEFLDACKKKRSTQLREAAKGVFKKFLEDSKPVIASVLLNNEMDSTTTAQISSELSAAFTQKFKDLTR